MHGGSADDWPTRQRTLHEAAPLRADPKKVDSMYYPNIEAPSLLGVPAAAAGGYSAGGRPFAR